MPISPTDTEVEEGAGNFGTRKQTSATTTKQSAPNKDMTLRTRSTLISHHLEGLDHLKQRPRVLLVCEKVCVFNLNMVARVPSIIHKIVQRDNDQQQARPCLSNNSHNNGRFKFQQKDGDTDSKGKEGAGGKENWNQLNIRKYRPCYLESSIPHCVI